MMSCTKTCLCGCPVRQIRKLDYPIQQSNPPIRNIHNEVLYSILVRDLKFFYCPACYYNDYFRVFSKRGELVWSRPMDKLSKELEYSLIEIEDDYYHSLCLTRPQEMKRCNRRQCEHDCHATCIDSWLKLNYRKCFYCYQRMSKSVLKN